MRLERSNQKNIVYTVGTGYFLKFGFRFRITFQITQFTDGSIAQFWPRLNEQYEQHPVHIAQAFQCQLSGIHGMLF